MIRILSRDLINATLLAGATIFPAMAQAADSADTIETIVVTAQKRTEKVQDVPVSISVITGRQLEQFQSTQLSDWVGYIPGLDITNNGVPGETSIAVDGIAPIGAASQVGIYVDDTPIGSSSSFQGGNGLSIDLMPYDLDRVEVLHGPQGTLYGASTMGGLLKYVLASPNLDQFSGRVGGDLEGVQNGKDVGGGGRGEVNVPIVDGELAVRASIYSHTTPGYIDSITTGQKSDNVLHQGGGRVAALWQANPDLSIELSAIYQRSHDANQSFVALNQATGQPFGSNLSNINARDEPFVQEFQLYNATVNWNFDWATLTSVSSYQNFTNTIVQDFTDYIGVYLGELGGPGPGQSDFYEHYRLQKFTQEVRLASPPGARVARGGLLYA
jgi:iron complex outermembrane receptor protein